MRFIKFIVLSAGMVCLFSTSVHAQGCPNSTPMDSPIWRGFLKFVQAEYVIDVPGRDIYFESFPDYEARKTRDVWLVLGHALGRLASAVQNDPDRRAAFECVQMAIEQTVAGGDHPGSLGAYQGVDFGYFRSVMEAAMGMDDAYIAMLTGVRSTEPLYDLFGGKLEDSGSSASSAEQSAAGPQAPSTIVKQDPAAVGGVASQTGQGGSLGGHCSNWIVSSLKDQNGNNQAVETRTACTILGKSGDFISRYDSTTQSCLLCAREDWTSAGSAATARSDGTTAGGTHQACADPQTPPSASWLFYGRGGGGTVEYFEKGGAICNYPRLGYTTYSGSQMKAFTCEKGYVNCRPGKETPITRIEPKEKYTIYWIGTGRSRGHRTPQETTETDDHDQDENQPERAAQETVAQQATSEKDARRPHIEHWLANASPLGNTRRGYALKYDQWGRVSGATPTGTITLSGKPDNAGADNVDYVWARAGELGSVNLCTLKDYVERKLAGKETVSCRMTIPTPVPAQVVDSRNVGRNAVPDLVGAPAARAKTQLSDMGVKIKWQAGSVPTSAAKAGTVEKQKPAAGTDLGKVYQVELWVYRGERRTVSVPDVTGLPYANAAVRLKNSGLSAALGRTLPAPSTDKNGLVSYQAVKAGDQVAEGATVSLNVYGSAGKVRVPDVTGKPYDEAAAILRDRGLNPKRKPGPNANTKAQAGTVQSMSHPANQPVELGTDIAVTVFNIHNDTPLPDGLTKVESPEIVKSDPASAFGHPESNGNGEGLNASPGSSASRATPRQFNCDPGISGLVVDKSRQIRGRGQGIVAADSIADSLYYCAYSIDGESYTLGVAFHTQQPKAGSYQAKSLVSTCKVDRNFAHGKAISIFPADAQPLNALSDRSKRLWEYRELFKFHADQVRLYAISCP